MNVDISKPMVAAIKNLMGPPYMANSLVSF